MKRQRELTSIAAAILFAILTSGPLRAQETKPPAPPAAPRVETNIIFGMYSGLALVMDVHYPANPNGYGIIFIPGSGWLAPMGYDARPLKDDSLQVGIFTKPLLAAGYTIFVIDHRATPRFHFPAAVEDAQRAGRFIRQHAKDYKISPDHMGAMGYSSGANLASMLGVLEGLGDPSASDPVERESARVECVVAGGTPTDLTATKTPEGVAFVSAYIGRPFFPGQRQVTGGYKDFEDASPLYHVAAGDPPFLFFHGDKDTLLPIDPAERMEQALEKVGVPTKFVHIPGGTHINLLVPGGPDFLGEAV